MASERDRYVDLLRAVSICVVVLGHWLAGAVTVVDGGVSFANLLDVAPRTHPLTWLFQVMPVFFLVGGYANAASLASRRRNGGSIADWLRWRALRLLRPTTILLAVLLGVRLLAVALGADEELAHNATWAAATPLWFLVVYLAGVLLAPLAESAHRRWGLKVVVVLVVGVLVGDLLRLASGDVAPAAGNYLFGWLAAHQAGIVWRDGGLPATRAGAWTLVAGGLGLAVLLVGPGPYGVTMVGAAAAPDLTNTAPPTIALLALATAQTGLVLLLRNPATAWLTRPRVWAAVVRVNAVVLTVFLWHMAAMVIGGFLLVGAGLIPDAEIGSAGWFALRIPWFALLAVVLAGLVALLGRFETALPPDLREHPSPAAVGLGLAAVLAGLAALGVTDTNGMAPPVAGIPLVELVLITGGLVVLERAGHIRR